MKVESLRIPYGHNIFRIGLLQRRGQDGRGEFLGTCFPFRVKGLYLTAAHCVAECVPASIQIGGVHRPPGRPIPVATIHRHESADLAALFSEPGHLDMSEPFKGLTVRPTWGNQIAAVGYTEDAVSRGGTTVTALGETPRFLRGHIQRFIVHQSHAGYTYPALELSMPAPAGISGGPVIHPDDHENVLGVMTENRESSTFLAHVVSLEEGNARYEERVHSMINYGLCVWLHEFAAWLDDMTQRAADMVRGKDA